MQIKDIFEKGENGTLTYEQFSALAKESKANFTDLSEGNYVSKSKYEDDLKAKDSAIETLNGTIKTRDTDLAELKSKLEEAGTDAEKLSTLSSDFDGLKAKYDADVKAYQAQLKQQAYEFAVKEFANGKKFSSNAAKRDFVNSMIAKSLKMEDGKIIGASDFADSYSKDNADAFITDTPAPAEPTPTPTFSGPTGNTSVPPKQSLSELMKAKNENPNLAVDF